MSRSPKRYRGVVLTQQGIERLESAISTAQDEEKYGKRFTQAELSERANLSIKTIKKIRDRIAPVDETSVKTLFESFGLMLKTADYGLPELTSQLAEREPTPKKKLSTKIDWGEKPDTAIFFGRTEELATLNQWVMNDQCRLMTLLGMGGIGKTSLAAKLADQIYDQFDYVIWRSLREAPPLEEILVRLIQFLSDQQETEINLPNRLGERIIRLLHYLREHRCLLVLDNLESILQAESTGQFRDGYDDYGELIHRIGEAEHQSCLLLTSRECPRELAPMAGEQLPVRLWPVGGIDSEAGQEILKAKGLNLEDANNQGQELVHRYSGNPQALHLVATAIQREFLGDVDNFLEEEGVALEDVQSLLDQHLNRLAPLERSILFWLAINREPLGLDELMEDLLPPVTKRDVRSALRGLRDRYLIEIVGKQFTLQNVIMEFATERLVEQVSRELNTQLFDLFHTHALIKATAKDYVRKTQIRLILKFVAADINELEEFANQCLRTIRQHFDWATGYGPGNLLNLLCQSQSKVLLLDFSGLTLRQVYLEGMRLHKLNLASVSFINSSLTQACRRICAISCHPNGDLLATGDGDGQVQLWCLKNRQQVAILKGHANWIRSIAFSPDGQLLATGSEDTTIRLWDIQSRQCIHTFEGHSNWISSVVFSPNGQLLATGSEDATIRLWNIQKRQCIHIFEGHTNWVLSVAFSPDGQLLATSSEDTTIRLWDIQKRQCIHTFLEHTTPVWSVVFSPDGQLLATGSEDATVRLWDIQKRQCTHIFSEHTSAVRSVVFSPDSKLLATGSVDATIRLWDVQKRQCTHTFMGHTNWVFSIVFSPDGRTLATGSYDATIRLWDIQKQQCIHTITGYANSIRSVAFSPNGQMLAAGSGDAAVRLWDTQQQQCIHKFSGHTNWVLSVAFSPNGQMLATGSGDATIRLWDIQKRQYLCEFKGHTNSIGSVAFSPDSQLLATGSYDSTLRLWDTQQRQCIHKFSGHKNRIWSVAFSPNGQLLASGSGDNTIRLWDIQKQQCISTLTGHTTSIRSVAFSPDGQLLASGSGDNTIRLWDIQKRQCISTLVDHTNLVRSVTFSPNGQLLATGSYDSTIRLWDIQSLQCLKILVGHRNWVRSIAFNPNDQTLVSGSQDNTIRIWDVYTRISHMILEMSAKMNFTKTFESA